MNKTSYKNKSVFIEVLKSYKKCKLGKNKSRECTKFQYRLGYELVTLAEDIVNRKYTASKGKCFWITYPKNREIWASHFRDRVVHHLIVSPLEEIQEPKFSNQSFACRKGKGPFQAIKELQKQVKKISQGGNKVVYALQLDIRSFFISIDREVLRQKFLTASKHKPKAEKNLINFLVNQNFNHDFRDHFNPTRINKPSSMSDLEYKNKSWLFKDRTKGIPIGNLTSQFGANLYLNQVDHYIQRILKPKGYLRYMDDLTLLDTDLEKLKPLESVIQNYISKHLNQSLNFDKTELKPLTKGITYLGYICRQEFNLKEPLQIYPTKKKKYQFIKELSKIEKMVSHAENEPLFLDDEENKISPKKFNEIFVPHPHSLPIQKRPNELASLNSRLGLLKNTNSMRFKKRALEKFKYNLTENRDMPSDFAQKYCPVKIRKDFGSVSKK